MIKWVRKWANKWVMKWMCKLIIDKVSEWASIRESEWGYEWNEWMR